MKATDANQILDGLKVGDLVELNYEAKLYKVVGISKNFVLLYRSRSHEYTIIDKRGQKGTYNGISDGEVYCGPDWWVFGYHDGYRFNNSRWTNNYLRDLEHGETEISRNRVAVESVKVIENAK